MSVGEFSAEYQQMLTKARALMQEFGHNYLDTEHLLAAIVCTPACAGAEILCDYIGLTVDEVLEALVPYLPRTEQPNSRPSVPRAAAWNAQATRAGEYALRASLEFGHTVVGTETMLIGLVRIEHCRATQALRSLGITAVEVEGVSRNYIRMAAVRGLKPSPR